MADGIRLMRTAGPEGCAELIGYERPAEGVCNSCKPLLTKAGFVCAGKPIGRGNPQVTMNGGASTPKLNQLSDLAKCIG